MNKLTPPPDRSVKAFIAGLDELTAQDSQTLIEMMQRISKQPPRLTDQASLGFDTYHYKYSSGREGDGFIIGFHPKKGKTTIYLMDGTARRSELLASLGPHTRTGYCIYIKRLSDINVSVLEQILQQSYDYIKSESKDGPIDHILWKEM